jgi:hypothetical protein
MTNLDKSMTVDTLTLIDMRRVENVEVAEKVEGAHGRVL